MMIGSDDELLSVWLCTVWLCCISCCLMYCVVCFGTSTTKLLFFFFGSLFFRTSTPLVIGVYGVNLKFAEVAILIKKNYSTTNLDIYH